MIGVENLKDVPMNSEYVSKQSLDVGSMIEEKGKTYVIEDYEKQALAKWTGKSFFCHKYKYEPENPQRMVDWFTDESMKCLEVKTTEKGNTYYFSKRPPSLVRCAQECFHVAHTTLRDWCRDFEDFRDAYEFCKEGLAQLYVDGALIGAFSESAVKFILTNTYEEFKVKKVMENSFAGGAITFQLNAITPNVINGSVVPEVIDYKEEITNQNAMPDMCRENQATEGTQLEIGSSGNDGAIDWTVS
jgi:hypothetical protein